MQAEPVLYRVGLANIPRFLSGEANLRDESCWTCRKRRVKCDERPVACKCCENAGLACGGYDVELIWDAGERGEGSGSRRFRRQIRPGRCGVADARVALREGEAC